MCLIQQWLDSPQEYEAGRLLYEQYGLNRTLKRTLSHGPTAYNRSAVREELTKLAGRVHDGGAPYPVGYVGQAFTFTSLNQPGCAPAPAAQPAPANPQLLLDLDKQWKPLYKQASHLQTQLKHAKDVQQRGTWSHQILDLMDKVQAIWDTGAYVKEHGQLPPVAEVVPPPVLDLGDQAAVLKRRNNLRAQVSKQKHNKERADEVAAWKIEIEQLDNVLQTF
ncbi:hypothetical protein [Hymenobacter baengnokdamensis]|uniref:hypothetical protein n=1 Tax=Hymenobacter baengnokdamensis TaxID=2615203 RepID=UPI001243E6FD|nr:hypothetical protein [Hymenobacter baengnokdamensis]